MEHKSDKKLPRRHFRDVVADDARIDDLIFTTEEAIIGPPMVEVTVYADTPKSKCNRGLQNIRPANVIRDGSLCAYAEYTYDFSIMSVRILTIFDCGSGMQVVPSPNYDPGLPENRDNFITQHKIKESGWKLLDYTNGIEFTMHGIAPDGGPDYNVGLMFKPGMN